MTEMGYVELPDFSVCWGACNQQGGQCSACMNADPDALAGYCCSGANHHGGNGAVSNGDCPADAATAAVASPAPAPMAGMIATGVDQAAIAMCEPSLKAASAMSMRG